MKILICGAGFGGLALAASLKKQHHTMLVIEKQLDRQVQEDFVISLWNNGIHILESLGVGAHIQALSTTLTEEIIRHKSGKILAKIHYQSLIKQSGPVLQLFHADVQQVLRDATADIPTRFGTTVKQLEHDPEGVTVTLSDGSRDRFDLVVGADGVHSHVRSLLFGAQTGVASSGLRMWCTALPLPPHSINEPNDLFGEGEYIGVFPVRTEQMGVLFLATHQPQEPMPQEPHSYLQKRFDDFGWLVPDILSQLHSSLPLFASDIQQVTLKQWFQGRVVLLGDAAHAVSPTAALGGGMALEDAHVLAEELHLVDPTQIEQALARYVARRRPRITQVRHTADFLIWLASLELPAMTQIRNTMMHLMPASFLLQGMQPIVEVEA